MVTPGTRQNVTCFTNLPKIMNVGIYLCGKPWSDGQQQCAMWWYCMLHCHNTDALTMHINYCSALM